MMGALAIMIALLGGVWLLSPADLNVAFDTARDVCFFALVGNSIAWFRWRHMVGSHLRQMIRLAAHNVK